MKMISTLYYYFLRIFSRKALTNAPNVSNILASESAEQQEIDTSEAKQVDGASNHFFHVDEHQIERARTQWQLGDWQSLAQIDRDTLENHPERDKLVLFVAAGMLQLDQTEEAKQYLRLALEWGVSKNLIARMLVAGVHNSLGRAAAIADEQPRSLQHFQSALATGTPGSDSRLLVQARIFLEYQQLGHLSISMAISNNESQAKINSINSNFRKVY